MRKLILFMAIAAFSCENFESPSVSHKYPANIGSYYVEIDRKALSPRNDSIIVEAIREMFPALKIECVPDSLRANN